MGEFDLLYLFPFVFVGFWFFIASTLMRWSGMKRELDVEPGRMLRTSRWGSASINGVSARGCAKLEEYADGFVVRIAWIFGGGKLWIPKVGLKVSEERPRALLTPRSRVMMSGMNQVILFDQLTEFLPATLERTL
jgi:hypothetical protein